MNISKYETVSLYCPNCGKRITGYKSDDGSLRIVCDKCRVSIFSKLRNKRELNIKVVLMPSLTYQ